MVLVKSSLNLLPACNHARIFQRAGGGGGVHCVKVKLLTRLSCHLLKGTQAPKDSPSYTPVCSTTTCMSRSEGAFQVYITKHF